MSSSRKEPWQYRGVARRIGDEAIVTPSPMAQQVVGIDVDPSQDVVEATTADVTNLQMVAASWLTMQTLDRVVEDAVEQFVVKATVAISGGGAIICAEAHSLSEEWQRLKTLVYKEGDTAVCELLTEMKEKGDTADGNAGIGATLQMDMQTSEEKANKERLEAKKQTLQATQRKDRAAQREKAKEKEAKKNEKRGSDGVVSDAKKRFRGSANAQPVWEQIVDGVKMDENSVDVD